jgi:hypothetical protein
MEEAADELLVLDAAEVEQYALIVLDAADMEKEAYDLYMQEPEQVAWLEVQENARAACDDEVPDALEEEEQKQKAFDAAKDAAWRYWR